MEPHRRRPQVALSLLTQRFWLALEANPLTVQNIADLYNLSPGGNNKTVIVRPASSVVFFFVSPEMALKDSCVSSTSASWSIHLCSVEKPLLFRAQPTFKQVAFFLLVNRTLLLLSLDSSKFMSRCFVLT